MDPTTSSGQIDPHPGVGVAPAETNDPLATIDIPNLIRETGDLIEDTRRDPDAIFFRIRKA